MHILQKHKANLGRLRAKIKSICAGAMFMGTLLLAQDAQAQNFNFGAAQANPFGLSANTAGNINTVSLGDLDSDGDLDLLAGSVGNYGGSFSYYENTGSSIAPAFATEQINPFGLSGQSYVNLPRFVDLDGDSDLDIMVGTLSGDFAYYENTGTSTAPAFAAVQTNPFSLTATASYVNNATFSDLDNDGDLDMLAGDYSGTWYYYANTGTSAAPAFAAVQTNPFGLTAVTTNDPSNLPIFFDADGDGDFDILRGGYFASFYYYENTGTATTPNYASEIVNPFGLATLPDSLNMFSIGDLDGDGDLDLMSGSYTGNFQYLQNNVCLDPNATISASMDTLMVTTAAIYTYQWLNCATNMPVAGQTSATFVPNMSGNFAVIATNTVNNCVDTSACFNFIYSAIAKSTENQTLIFPNPTQDVVNIQTSTPWTNATVRLVNLNGQVISQQQNVNGNQISLDLANLPKAIYIVEIEAATSVSRHKISKQ